MSVVVSYKKQVILGILLLIILLTIIEVFANIWLYNFYKCDFEDSEIFSDVDSETKRAICIESLGLEVFYDRLSYAEGWQPGKEGFNSTLVYINSEGTRGPEFTKEKPENTYRIFVLGGSTAFGTGVLDNQTWPFYLQHLFDESDLQNEIEVINAAWPGGWSYSEVKSVKEKWIYYEPDLFLVYDGINDIHREIKNTQKASANQWTKRWIEICELGKQNNFDTVIVLQPILGTGDKTLTLHEMDILRNRQQVVVSLEYIPSYLAKIDELNNHCTKVTDFLEIFDNIKKSVYFDGAHTGLLGNEIIAEEFYQLSFPIVMEGSKKIGADNDDGIQYLKIETDEPQVSSDMDYFLEESFYVLRDIISFYKTPKVLPLIFEE